MCLHTASILSPKTTCRTWHGTVLKCCNNHQPQLDPPNQNRTMVKNKKDLFAQSAYAQWVAVGWNSNLYMMYICSISVNAWLNTNLFSVTHLSDISYAYTYLMIHSYVAVLQRNCRYAPRINSHIAHRSTFKNGIPLKVRQGIVSNIRINTNFACSKWKRKPCGF